MIGTVAVAFLAGTLSILSPCVLPILPIVLGSAIAPTKWGPVALALGLCSSFVVVGLFVATVGYGIGLDGDLVRRAAGAILLALGAVLLLPRLSLQLSLAGGPVASVAAKSLDRVRGHGAFGQFGIGILLGAVWSPCVGPTLGAASILAAQQQDLGEVAATMFAFGLGAALPLLALGGLSREALLRWRYRLRSAGQGLKVGLGALLVVIGLCILTGLDKAAETLLVEASPDWLTNLTTRF
jgi:cytochrome c biogenesis protein CcdA